MLSVPPTGVLPSVCAWVSPVVGVGVGEWGGGWRAGAVGLSGVSVGAGGASLGGYSRVHGRQPLLGARFGHGRGVFVKRVGWGVV